MTTGKEDSCALTPPLVLWAQRNSCLYLTIKLEDCKNPEIKIDAEKLFFKGAGGTDQNIHECTLEFYDRVDADQSKTNIRARGIEFRIQKEKEAPYWPRLLKSSQKSHWLKVDFNKWKDEDDSDKEDGEGQNFEEMMRQMGGLGGGMGSNDMDFSGVGGGGGAGGGVGDEEESQDSDDEALPDLEG